MATSIVDVTSPQPEGKTPQKTQYDKSSGNETFYDFVMNNIKELNEKTNLKYDLSKDLHAVIFMCRPITARELVTRTSRTFLSSLTNDKGGVKVYEYFVYVPNISDYQLVPSVEEMEVFYRLKHASRALKDSETNKDGKSGSQELDDIKLILETQEMREGVVNMIEEKIVSLYRFYSVEEKTGSNLVHCKVRFYDENSLQYGKLTQAGEPLETGISGYLFLILAEIKSKYLKISGQTKATGKAKIGQDVSLTNSAKAELTDLLTGLPAATKEGTTLLGDLSANNAAANVVNAAIVDLAQAPELAGTPSETPGGPTPNG